MEELRELAHFRAVVLDLCAREGLPLRGDVVALLDAMIDESMVIGAGEMERAAGKALARRAALLDEAHDAVVTWPLGGTITFWSRGAQALYGWSASEALGRDPHELLQTQHPAGINELERVLTRDGRWEGELRQTARDGRSLIVEARLVVVRDEAEGPYVIESNHDITARKQAEEALRKSEARLRRLWESNIIGVMYTDADGNIRDANDAVLCTIGYTREELAAGQVRWSDLTLPEYLPLDAAGIAEARERGACTPYEKVYIGKDGRHVPILIGYAALDEAGHDFICFMLDLRALKQAEEAHRASEARLRAIVDSAVDAILTVDESGIIESFNPAAERMFGYRAQEVVGRNVSMLVPELHQEPGERRIIGIGREVSGRHKHGAVFAIDLVVSETWLDSRRVFTGILRDICERKRIENEREQLLGGERTARAEAERAAHLRDEFVATVSHELRTPLNAILGWTGMLRSGKLNAAATAKALEVVERNARAQAELVEDLLDVSRIGSGKLRLDVREVNLGAIVEQAVASHMPEAQKKHLVLDAMLDGSDCSVRGDSGRLEQIVSNLLSNAIKFTPAGGRVQVLLRRVGSRAELAIVDTGQGIAEDFLPHVFDRFRQADASLTRQHRGLGLGLALVKFLVEQHGGDIRAESEGEGRGATFIVRLPIATVRQQDEGLPISPIHACATLEGVRALVVDDEEDARTLLQRILEECGVEVVAVGSAAAAIEQLPRFRPDVLISDIGMPELDGYQLIRTVRALDPTQGGMTPAVALTAFARPEDRRRALQAGYQMHLTKPVEQAEFIVAIANVTGQLSRQTADSAIDASKGRRS